MLFCLYTRSILTPFAGRLQPPAIKQFVTHLLKEGENPSYRLGLSLIVCTGLISADPPQQSSTYLIYWKKPEEWASVIYSWVSSTAIVLSYPILKLIIVKVSDNGLTGSIMTFYELTEGDMAHTTGARSAEFPLHSLIGSQSSTSFHLHCCGERSTCSSSGERHKYSRVKT